MNPDDKICHCYHVPLRKLLNFVRQRRPGRASQMSECLGAGTGCGWCVPILKRIFERAKTETPDLDVGMTAQEYESQRADYIKSGKPKNTF